MEILSCSLWCVAPCRRSGARLAQWRPSALLLLSFVLALCRARAHFCWMFILTHATALIAVSFKTVISTAPSSTFFHFMQHHGVSQHSGELCNVVGNLLTRLEVAVLFHKVKTGESIAEKKADEGIVNEERGRTSEE